VKEFGFGQPLDTVIQIAFVVENLEDAMGGFGERLGAGPWTVFRDFAGDNPRYHGEPTDARAHIALGFAGRMQYELIQPADDLPSVHRDVIQERGYGFHHFGYAAPDFDASVARMRATGYEPVFEAEVDGGDRVAYFDTRDVLPGMLEFIEASPGLDGAFTPMYRAWLAARADGGIR
jgi:hypothetical protein